MILHVSTGDFLHDLLTPSVETGFAFLLVLIGALFIALAVRARRRAASAPPDDPAPSGREADIPKS